jgi:hypothetical protein
VHPQLTHRATWLDHDGDLPVIEGTLIRLQVDYLPGDRDPKPVWLWWSCTGAAPADVDRCWQSFLRRLWDLADHVVSVQRRLGPVVIADLWTAGKPWTPASAALRHPAAGPACCLNRRAGPGLQAGIPFG